MGHACGYSYQQTPNSPSVSRHFEQISSRYSRYNALIETHIFETTVPLTFDNNNSNQFVYKSKWRIVKFNLNLLKIMCLQK